MLKSVKFYFAYQFFALFQSRQLLYSGQKFTKQLLMHYTTDPHNPEVGIFYPYFVNEDTGSVVDT